MPEEGVMTRHLEEAIRKAERFLRKECGACRLPNSEASAVPDRSFVAGWQVMLETASQRRVNVYADRQFPLSLPHFLLVDRAPFPSWPHVEPDGLLCLDNRAVPKFRQPEDVIGVLLRDACRLIRECESGANENDFRTEFFSYWNRQLSAEDVRVRSLLDARGPSRLVQVWRGQTRPVVGETEAQVLGWLRNLNGNKPQFDSTEDACLLWIAQPQLPRTPRRFLAFQRPSQQQLRSTTPFLSETANRGSRHSPGPFFRTHPAAHSAQPRISRLDASFVGCATLSGAKEV
jgi:hypothetical protein